MLHNLCATLRFCCVFFPTNLRKFSFLKKILKRDTRKEHWVIDLLWPDKKSAVCLVYIFRYLSIYSGVCTYIPPGLFKSTCNIDITWFPFDDQVENHLVPFWSPGSPGSPLTTRWKCLKIEMEQQIMSDERCETRNNKCQMTNVRWKMTIVSRYSLYLYISRLTLP